MDRHFCLAFLCCEYWFLISDFDFRLLLSFLSARARPARTTGPFIVCLNSRSGMPACKSTTLCARAQPARTTGPACPACLLSWTTCRPAFTYSPPIRSTIRLFDALTFLFSQINGVLESQKHHQSHTLQRHNIENSKQIFPENELRGLIPNFHIHVSDIYIPTIVLPILIQENRWIDPGNI